MQSPSPSAPEKRDLKRELKPLYTGKAGMVQEVAPGTHHFLCHDGTGDPNTSPDFKAAVTALFGTAYHLKFTIKKELEINYGVMPLEGLWWSDDISTFSVERKSEWKWTMMILQPEMVTGEHFERSRAAVSKRSGADLSGLRFERFAEGRSVQILHVGPFSEEGPAVEALHQSIEAAGRRLSGKHHEIYLSDFRRGDPARWKTLIRQPYADD